MPGTDTSTTGFDLQAALVVLGELLPHQAPLKDFVHHNPLNAFQGKSFEQGLAEAAHLLGYQVYLPLDEYRSRYHAGAIRPDVLQRVLQQQHPDDVSYWRSMMLEGTPASLNSSLIGQCRKSWQQLLDFSLDEAVHPRLFRWLGGYLDQGIAVWSFPRADLGLFEAFEYLETRSGGGLLRSRRARELLSSGQTGIPQLLELLVGDPAFHGWYLLDQQFSHPGWSGMVAQLESHPESLLSARSVSLADLIRIELLLEIDALASRMPQGWPLLTMVAGNAATGNPLDLVAGEDEYLHACYLFQLALEWSYYEQVLAAVQDSARSVAASEPVKCRPRRSFQAVFCIDDRCESIRRHVEQLDSHCETLGTPGFFAIDAFYQPHDSQFHSKICPPPVRPGYLLREQLVRGKVSQSDFHHSRHTTNLFGGMMITHTLGLWSAVKLFLSIFRPHLSAQGTSSAAHMDPDSLLGIDALAGHDEKAGLRLGYRPEEMVARAAGLLNSIGFTGNFAEQVYLVGHGASSVNNPYYAAYDCGACSGRPGSVNARVMANILNRAEVRDALVTQGIHIPEDTRFIGALHDTTRDDLQFFDLDALSAEGREKHRRHAAIFAEALKRNAAERARRFELTEQTQYAAHLHDAVRERSVSVFEPRPELNHATNAICIIGRRSLSRRVFLDRRAFLNSYDCRSDQQGLVLASLLKAAAPVCGGINLEYYFSRVDPHNLGAGSKLPHNVMGLIGVANGVDGDLRTGLPTQMTELHDPVRMLVIVEQAAGVVLGTLQKEEALLRWFANHWMHLVVMDPDTRQLSYFDGEDFVCLPEISVPVVDGAFLHQWLESRTDNLPVCFLNQEVA